MLELRGSKSDKQAIHVIAMDHQTSELIAPLHRAQDLIETAAAVVR